MVAYIVAVEDHVTSQRHHKKQLLPELKTLIFCRQKSRCMICANIVHVIIMSFTTFSPRNNSTDKSENVPIVSLKIRANSILFKLKYFQ